MDELLQRIIQIEMQAQRMVSDSRQQQENLETEIKQSVEEMQAQLNRECETRIKKIQDTEKSFEIAAVEKIHKQSERNLENMNKVYIANKDKWVNEMFERVIKI